MSFAHHLRPSIVFDTSLSFSLKTARFPQGSAPTCSFNFCSMLPVSECFGVRNLGAGLMR